MPQQVGTIEAIYRYPVKSMRGESLETAAMGWYGIAGDRRLAFRRLGTRGGNPWLSAGRLADLVHFTPVRREVDAEALPTHVRTPEGEEMPLRGEALRAEVEGRLGAPVEMMQLRRGIFDEASISVLASSSVREIGRLTETPPDVRRFRPNLLIRSVRDVPFEEDDWVGGTIAFGEGDDAPAVAVTRRDLRCVMVNIDPEGGGSTPAVTKACVTANDNHVGVYCTVTRVGQLAVGQPVLLHR
ncbi:MAG: MOSC domain-containing protein [Myxococcota bacterium]